MRRASCVSFLLLILPAYAVTVSHRASGRDLSTDFKVFEWCLSHFPREESGVVELLPRPPGKLRSFDLSSSTAPAGLVGKTRTVGKLPPSIESYQGYWTWPSIDKPERMFLSWTGTHFAYSGGTPNEFREMEIRVSQSGDFMAGLAGYTRTQTLIDKDGKESSHTFREGWPYCFVSERYDGAP